MSSATQQPRPYLMIPADGDSILELVYLPDGRRVVSGSEDGTVKVWNLESGGQEGITMKHRSEVVGLAVTQDSTKIISSDEIRSIKVWDIESQELVQEWTHPHGYPNIAISPDDRFVAVGNWTVHIYSMEGKRVNHTIDVREEGCDSDVWCMSFSPNSDKLACSIDHHIRVYDVKTGELVLGPLHGHKGDVTGVLWSCDGTRLFSGSHDNTVRSWNAETGGSIGHPWTGHTNAVLSLSLSPDGSILASASWDRTVRFWDTASGNPMGQRLRHKESVNAVSFSPSGEFVASAGRQRVYFWQVPQRTTASLPRVLRSLAPSYSSLLAITHSAPSRSCPASLPTAERQSQPSTFCVEFPLAVDLTHHIVKIRDQYSAVGSYGDVYKCRYLGGSVPMEVAVKAFRFKFTGDGKTGSKSEKMIRRELGIWRRLAHDNIVPFLGITHGFGMEGTVSLVSLWMSNGSLHHFLEKHDSDLGVEHRLRFLQGIASGLHYLHSTSVVHGDLNCNNVLLDADYTARLTDFGYACLVGNIPEALAYLQRSTTRPGALRWSAPEQILSEDMVSWTTKGDIYSFGCVALQESFSNTYSKPDLMSLQALSGKQPWSEIQADGAVILRLAKGHKPGRPESRIIDDLHWNLIQECWSPVEERPTTEVIKYTIQAFLESCPQSPTLHDIIKSWSSQAGPAEFLPSLDEIPMEQYLIHAGGRH